MSNDPAAEGIRAASNDPPIDDSLSAPSFKPLDLIFSKWTALLAVLLLIGGVALSLWLPYQRRGRAIQEIKAAGGVVDDYFAPGGPRWLRHLVGDEAMQGYFDVPKLTSIDASLKDYGDEDLKHLAGLTKLRYLDLNNTQVSDDGLQHLARMTKLELLSLNSTQVGDEGLKHLAGLAQLLTLRLGGTHVSDEGLKHLAGLTKLEYLVNPIYKNLINTQEENGHLVCNTKIISSISPA